MLTVLPNAMAQAAGFTTHVALRAARACLNAAVTTLIAAATSIGFLAPAKSKWVPQMRHCQMQRQLKQ